MMIYAEARTGYPLVEFNMYTKELSVLINQNWSKGGAVAVFFLFLWHTICEAWGLLASYPAGVWVRG